MMLYNMLLLFRHATHVSMVEGLKQSSGIAYYNIAKI